MQSIIYKNGDNSVCILAYVEGCGLTIEQVAQKDVPEGVQYSIVDASTINLVTGYNNKLYLSGEEPTKTTYEQVLDIENTYLSKLSALDTALISALWAGGENEVATRQALSAKRQQLIADKTAAITNIFING